MQTKGIAVNQKRLFMVLAVAAGITAGSVRAQSYADPARFEGEVKKFESADAEQRPPSGAVLCIGSSTMRMWHPAIREDLAPLTVIPRGFGGSTMNDVLHFADRMVLPYKPRAILLYEGDNDTAAHVSAALFQSTLESFVKKVHAALPESRIYLLAVKPSISRIKLLPAVREYNAVMQRAAEASPLITYIDVFSPMLGPEGGPLPHIFKEDNLHLNREGYLIWRDAIRPVLVEAEKKYEQSND